MATTTANTVSSGRTSQRLSKFAWGVLVYNIAVIVWGAYVRATGAGAGCGNHWPLCNGEVLPRSARLETLIEFSHRVTSGLAAVLVLGLFVACWRALPKRHPARVTALLAGLLMISEALIGALLVKLALVAQDKSVLRAISLPIHSTNTMLLLAAIAATALWISREAVELAWDSRRAWLAFSALAALLITTAAGVIAALGDTLFPRATIAADFSSASHFLLRLRVLHPVLAVLTTAVLAWFVSLASRENERARRFAGLVGISVVLQLFLGMMNIALLAPVWLQMLHLAVADVVWVATVLVAAETLFHPEINLKVA